MAMMGKCGTNQFRYRSSLNPSTDVSLVSYSAAARMYHTTTLISENRLLLLFGRTSPCKCCERAYFINIHGSQDTTVSAGASVNTQQTRSLGNITQRLDSVSSQYQTTKPDEVCQGNKHKDLLRFNAENNDSIPTGDRKSTPRVNASVENSIELSQSCQCNISCEEICQRGDVPCPRWRHSSVAVTYNG